MGLVTTTTVTHATPAGFAIQNPDRNAEEEIAQQYLEFGAEVYLGGGQRFFDRGSRKDGRDMYAAFADRGYGVARTLQELESQNASRLLGVFSPSHIPYEIDRRFQGVAVPSLAQMVRKALQILPQYRGGFVLQVEAGRIDHANHLNDAATTLWEILAADEALELLLSFAERYPETLLLVVSDHATGNPALYGTGPSYRLSSQGIDLLRNEKASLEFILGRLGREPSLEAVTAAYREFKGVNLTPDQVQAVAAAVTQRVYLPDGVRYGIQPANTLAWVMRQTQGNAVDRPNIGWASGQHTASPVLFALYAQGLRPGRVGLVDNTYVYTLLGQALGIRHQNPVLTEEEALELLRKGQDQGWNHPEDTLVLV